MAKTTGLVCIVRVKVVGRAVRFYCDAFGPNEIYRGDTIVFVGTPGSDSAIGILRDDANAGSAPQNVGLHLDHAIALDHAIRDIESADGEIIERGEHAPGVPFGRIADPDGDVVEI